LRLFVLPLALAIAVASSQASAQGAPAPPAPPPPPAAPAAPSPPAAGPSGPAESAAGDKAAKAKDWAGALTHYQAALQLAPTAHAQLGAADALYQLGRAADAYDAYTVAQGTYGPKLAGADKATVAARLKELATKTGALSLHVEDSGADVALDGKSIGTAPMAALLRVAVGPHEVRVSKMGFVPFVGTADVQPDGKAVVDATPMAPQPTRGHVIVHAPGTEPLRVIIDGIDLGATPWEGDLPAGQHEITGRSSTSSASAQTLTVSAGDHVTIDLVSAATAAHLQVRSNDGQGKVYVDGVQRGEGGFAGDVAPGSHTVVIERESYERFEKTVTLGERETWAETVSLKPAQIAVAPPEAADRAMEGIYGGFGFLGLFGVGGQGTELDTNCDGLGASACQTGNPLGGGAMGYLGWTWDPVGFELFLAGGADTLSETAHFTESSTGATSPLSLPPRDEKFTFVRAGGLAALRVRASVQWHLVRASIAGGVGLSYRLLFMKRDTNTTDGTNRIDVFSPNDDTKGFKTIAYLSPALSIEGTLQLRVTPTLAIAVGLEMWADNASIAGSNSSQPSSGRMLVNANPSAHEVPAPVSTPAYHLASGPQVFLGPMLGLQFGP
jgi:PEGA domain